MVARKETSLLLGRRKANLAPVLQWLGRRVEQVAWPMAGSRRQRPELRMTGNAKRSPGCTARSVAEQSFSVALWAVGKER